MIVEVDPHPRGVLSSAIARPIIFHTMLFGGFMRPTARQIVRWIVSLKTKALEKITEKKTNKAKWFGELVPTLHQRSCTQPMLPLPYDLTPKKMYSTSCFGVHS